MCYCCSLLSFLSDLKLLHGFEKIVELYISKPELGNEKAILKAEAEIATLQAKRDENMLLIEKFQLYLTCPLDGGARESNYAASGPETNISPFLAGQRYYFDL